MKDFYGVGVVFVNTLTLVVFPLKVFVLNFCNVYILYTFCCHAFSHHFCNAYTLKLVVLNKKGDLHFHFHFPPPRYVVNIHPYEGMIMNSNLASSLIT
jgi:hypothetical protein